MKDCELCGLRARMHCESDQASLCWDCDEKVHGANFLVAKHTRSLLCHVCHSPTPWKASGPKLNPTVSVCETCVDCHGRRFERGPDDGSQGGNDESQGGNDEDQDDLVDDDEIDEADLLSVDGDYEDFSDEDGENQVVPWSFSSPPPPPAAETATVAYSSTTSEEEERLSVSKRMREDANPDSDVRIFPIFLYFPIVSREPNNLLINLWIFFFFFFLRMKQRRLAHSGQRSGGD